jgi:hypothetical protein
VRGFGAQSNDAEYINIDSIEPRLYFLTRVVMDVAQGKTEQGPHLRAGATAFVFRRSDTDAIWNAAPEPMIR